MVTNISSYLKKILFILILLNSSEIYAATTINSAKWMTNSAAGYNECGIFGSLLFNFFCKTQNDVYSDVNSAAIRSTITIFNKNDEVINTFKIKKIYYDKAAERCWITPQPIRNFTTYYTVSECNPN